MSAVGRSRRQEFEDINQPNLRPIPEPAQPCILIIAILKNIIQTFFISIPYFLVLISLLVLKYLIMLITLILDRYAPAVCM